MSSRRDIFLNNKYYHVFNKSLDKRKIFSPNIAKHFLNLLTYYRSSNADIRYSVFKRMPEELKKYKEKLLTYHKYYKVEIIAFCLMPNHFHLLLKQIIDGGIIRFMSDIINSTTRYFNILSQRLGPLFIPQFKSRMIITDEQFIHISRYIHLNPYSSGIVNTLNQLINYPYSSFSEYLSGRDKIISSEYILKYFNNNIENYKKFVLDNAEYQKTLEAIKHVKVEKWI